MHIILYIYIYRGRAGSQPVMTLTRLAARLSPREADTLFNLGVLLLRVSTAQRHPPRGYRGAVSRLTTYCGRASSQRGCPNAEP